MNRGNGVDTKTAMTHLLSVGYTPARIASDLHLTTRTVRRWAAGIHQPRRSNLAALRELVADYRRQVVRRRVLNGRADDALFMALVALETEAERAEIAALVARAHVPAPRKPVSITAHVDPFELVHGGRLEPALPF